MSRWIIGIDGGGTKCEAGLFSSNGDLLETALAGPANLYSNFEGAINAIEQASELVLQAYSKQHKVLAAKKDCFLSVGCAGGSIASIQQQFTEWQHGYAGAMLNTDVHTSCLSANNAQPCALFVIGTGSCLAVSELEQTENGNAKFNVKQFGGHGFLLGDIASGAWLGKQALSWYLQALESPQEDSVLLAALGSTLGRDISRIIERYGQAPARDFGALVPVLLSVKQSSVTVNQWLQEGAQYVATLLNSHNPYSNPIYLTGGLAVVYKPLVEAIIDKDVFTPKESPVYGAYLASQSFLQA
jgi:glucosamine kinase